MYFYVYEHWTAEKKAIVHKGTCLCCNDGTGHKGRDASDRNGRWHGKFGTAKEAFTFAKNLKRKRTDYCGHCLKELKILGKTNN